MSAILQTGAKILAASALLTALALPLMAQEDSKLRRLTLRSDTLGWEAVGRLDISGEGYCTAVLLRPDIVLTAAHCLIDRQKDTHRDPATITFRAGLRDGKSVADRTALRAVVHRKYNSPGENGRSNTRYDVALLQLSEPIAAAIAAPFKVQSFAALGRRVSVVSYAKGRDETLSRQKSCGVLGHNRNLAAFSCDVDFGSSGAPVFNITAGRARIVSIISGGKRDGVNITSIGMELPDLLDDLYADLRGGRGVFPKASLTAKRLRVGDTAQETGALFLRP